MAFHKATKLKAKLKLALEGVAGTGKTYSALKIATQLLKADPGGRIALIDSEHGSASLYAHLFDFDTAPLEEFSLQTYINTIDAAKNAGGYSILIIDSLSHAWNGKGGALEQVDKIGGSKFTNGWRAVTPLQTQLVNTILAYPGHVIATMRTKMEYALEKDEHTGKVSPKKLSLAPIQREGMDYEFSVVLDLQQGGAATVTKSRCDALVPGSIIQWSEMEATADTLLKWLSSGAERSRVDMMMDEIRSVTNRPSLMALVPIMKTLSDTEQEALRGPWRTRAAEFPEEPA